ncbi:hydrolase [Kiloniella majae]|uniref:hydrolase n=1 Tax=Kiloniella majae TaxID=1938558 RepID=UPI0013023260|nr:hydrolase [Kiloniella majae]
MSAEDSVVVVIDIQERLAPAIPELDSILKANELVLKTAAELSVPVLVTEQYPKGLGHTVEQLHGLYAEKDVFEKISFSSAGCKPFMSALKETGRRQVIVMGIEAHVCVQQTVLELLSDRFDVFVVADAIGSRADENRKLALERMIRSGAEVVSSEMVMFEMLKKAGTPEFKKLSNLLKEND